MPDTSAPGEAACEPHVVIRAPERAWGLLHETLRLDAQSKAFDPQLRRDVADALAQVEVLPNGSAPEALRRIFDRLYLDMTPGGDVYTTGKHWDEGALHDIAEIVRPFFEHLLEDHGRPAHAERTSTVTSPSTSRKGDGCL